MERRRHQQLDGSQTKVKAFNLPKEPNTLKLDKATTGLVKPLLIISKKKGKLKVTPYKVKPTNTPGRSSPLATARPVPKENDKAKTA